MGFPGRRRHTMSFSGEELYSSIWDSVGYASALSRASDTPPTAGIVYADLPGQSPEP